MAKDRNPQAQRLRDMYQAQDEARKAGTLIADFPNRTAFDQAMYNRTQEIAASRAAGAQPLATDMSVAGREKQEITIPENVMTASNEAFRGLTNSSIPAFPSSANFGPSGFSRSMPTSGGGQAIQVAGPYGFAQTSLTPQQVEQREQARQQAQQMGTMPRTPEEQQALLAQARQRGAALGQQRVANMEEFFKQKRAEGTALAQATKEAYEAGMGSQSIRQARNAYTSQQPSSVAGIRKQFQSMIPEFKSPMEQRSSVAGIRSFFNLPVGGPQPAQGMNLASQTPILDNRFGNPFGSIFFGYGS